MRNSFSLYIHIPFCSSFCDYCDFYSVNIKDAPSDYFEKYLNAVITDIMYQIEYFKIKEIPSVYIGGGTPSLLGQRIGVLFDALNKIDFFSPIEFTVEANPESLTEEFLSACRQGGVNRLSLGVQTFHEPSRKAVRRFGNAFMLEEKTASASRFFPDNLSIDLITGLPFQNKETVLEDIKRILKYNPVHVSLYSLTIEKNTALEEKIKFKKITLPDENTADELWLASRDALAEAGFTHYEVSSFAKNGKECLHNIRYWQMKSWLGAGPAASGTVIDESTGTAKRFAYSHNADDYIKNPSIQNAAFEELDRKTLIKESLLMGFRYCKGPDKELFKKRFGLSVDECIPNTLANWQQEGGDKIMIFLNKFLEEAFDEMETHGNQFSKQETRINADLTD